VLLTSAMIEYASTDQVAFATLAWHIPLQLVVGAVLGVGIGFGCHQALVRLPPSTAGLFPVVTSAAAAIAYGGTTLVGGSGFLAVYVCGLVLATRKLPDRNGVLRVHDFLAWAAQVGLFLALGLLVHPSELAEGAALSLALATVLVVFARPLAVALCLVPFRYPAREIAYVGWVGLRGAVPIVLATFPFLAGVPGAERLFNIVFFVVLVSVVVQAGSVGQATRLVGLTDPAPPPPEASIEIASMRVHDAEVACYHIDTRAAVANVPIAEVPFPESAAIMLVVRGERLLPARADVVLIPGDHVYVLCKPEDEAAVALWFGQRIDR
jgi:cell volume regulation protein A